MSGDDLLERSHVVMFKDEDRDWRWRLVAANGKSIAVSGEGLKNRTHAEDICKRLFGENITFKYVTRGEVE